MSLFDEGLMFLVNDRLVVLVNVLLDNHGLVMLMQHLLMVLMDYVFLVLNIDIFVMLMNHVLMDFLLDRLGNVGSDLRCEVVHLNPLSLVAFLEVSLLLMLNVDRLLHNLFDNGLIASKFTVDVLGEYFGLVSHHFF